jgi:hypothetical protein
MDEEAADFDDGLIADSEEVVDSADYEVRIGSQRHDVRRKIEELLERKRLREEFGELNDY